MGEIWGVKVSTSPLPPSISLRQISECRRPGAGLVPGYNPRDFGKSAGNVDLPHLPPECPGPTTGDITAVPFPTVCMTPRIQKRQTGSSMIT